MNEVALRLTKLIQTFRAVPGAALGESVDTLRIVDTECTSDDDLRELNAISLALTTDGLGRIMFHGNISGEIDTARASCADYAGEKCRVTIEKSYTTQWCYFLTLEGLGSAIQDPEFSTQPRTIWIAAEFEKFSSHTLYVVPWGDSPKEHQLVLDNDFERPRRLVRDQTLNAPDDIRPWLLTSNFSASPVLALWQAVAIRNLAFSLPFEIRQLDKALHVILRGPRSNPIPVDGMPAVTEQFFGLLLQAVEWVYSPAREAETKFTFLNYHLSLDWPQGEPWPTALPRVLPGSFASARDAFAYHLHAQASESLKSMGDLRRSLQDEVTKVQQATRDLVTALWRDFAVAGVVLALRSPNAKDVISSEALRLVTLGAALLLALSLLITITSTLRFNILAARGRKEWRKRSYAFIPENDWDTLVETPLRSGRRVFWTVVVVVSLFYCLAVGYLVSVGLSDAPKTDPSEPRFIPAQLSIVLRH